MGTDWIRPAPELSSDGTREGVVLRPPKAASERPWVLFVGENERALENAARKLIDWSLPVISPPPSPLLPIAVEELPPPSIAGERVLYAPRIERGFFDTPLSAASPLYLLPRLAQLAGEGAALAFVATAIESELGRRAKNVLAQRGLASRFEIRRVPGESRGERVPEEDLDRALRSRPDSALAHLFRASTLDALRRAVAIDPELPCARYELGKALIQADDLSGAVAEFRKTVELLPDYASAWGNLGASLGELKDFEGAATALKRAVELDPENAPLHSNLGVTYRDQGRLAEAESQFRCALELDPEFVFGHYNLAHTLFLAERYEEAIETFERAQSMDRSRSSRQALLLACARLASGDVSGAHRDYREVFEHLPEPSRKDHRAVAEWDLKQLSQRKGLTPELEETASLLRALA
ncbi:MAG TPA: tetratricopeptide repeat protein [Vicinamibacteria bacterium]|jgi:Flp pilus assembly protein TadD